MEPDYNRMECFHEVEKICRKKHLNVTIIKNLNIMFQKGNFKFFQVKKKTSLEGGEGRAFLFLYLCLPVSFA